MAISLAAVLALLLSAAPNEQSAPGLTVLEVQRLVNLGRLWSTVKTFHPALFTTDIDWDAALIEAVPRVRSAQEKEQYAAVVVVMRARRGGPGGTHLVTEPEKPSTPVPPSAEPVRWAEGKVLVLAMAHVPYSKQRDVQKQAEALLPQARGVVVDVRDDNLSEGQLSFLREQVGVLRAAGAPRMLYVEHHGYRQQEGGSSGRYDSFLVAREPDVLRQVSGRPVIPITFVVRPSIGVLPTALAFQAAGNGRIVSEGPLTDEAVVPQETVDLGEGLSALVRGAVLEGVVFADVVVGPEKVMNEAIRLTRSGMPRGPPRRASRAVTGAWRPDKTYSETPYPSEALRVLAGVRLWFIVRWFYPYRHLLTEDWDQVLATFIPKLIGAHSAEEYAFALAEMSTHIPDGHTGIRGFDALSAVYDRASPAVEVRLVEGEDVVTRILNADAAPSVRVGDVISSVGGQPVSVRVNQLSPLLAASTPEAHRHAIARFL